MSHPHHIALCGARAWGGESLCLRARPVVLVHWFVLTCTRPSASHVWTSLSRVVGLPPCAAGACAGTSLCGARGQGTALGRAVTDRAGEWARWERASCAHVGVGCVARGRCLRGACDWSEQSSAGIDHAEEMELLLENYHRLAEDLAHAARELRALIDDSQSVIFLNLDRWAQRRGRSGRGAPAAAGVGLAPGGGQCLQAPGALVVGRLTRRCPAATATS